MIVLLRIFALWLFMGGCYILIELMWRGRSHWSMMIVGGLCGLFAGSLVKIPLLSGLPVLALALIGTVATLFIELISGCILNRRLRLGVWDYTGKRFAILGQICPQYGAAWFFLMPAVMWFADMFRYILWHEGAPYRIWEIYLRLFSGQ